MEVEVRQVYVNIRYNCIICFIQVLGVTSDSCKMKFHASAISGFCVLWREGNTTLLTNIAFPTLTVIKFSVFIDKGPCKNCNRNKYFQLIVSFAGQYLHNKFIPLSSINSGYQHIYLSDFATCDLTKQPSSLFIHVMVRFSISTYGS